METKTTEPEKPPKKRPVKIWMDPALHKRIVKAARIDRNSSVTEVVEEVLEARFPATAATTP